MEVKTYGHARKRGVPDLPGTAPRVCGKCDSWFAAASQQRLCGGCIPARRRTERYLRKCVIKTTVHPSTTVPELMTHRPTSPGPNLDDRARYGMLCGIWARHTRELMDWLERTRRPVREYPDYPKLTAREIQVAIGWVPWPASWPEKAAA